MAEVFAQLLKRDFSHTFYIGICIILSNSKGLLFQSFIL